MHAVPFIMECADNPLKALPTLPSSLATGALCYATKCAAVDMHLAIENDDYREEE